MLTSRPGTRLPPASAVGSGCALKLIKMLAAESSSGARGAPACEARRCGCCSGVMEVTAAQERDAPAAPAAIAAAQKTFSGGGRNRGVWATASKAPALRLCAPGVMGKRAPSAPQAKETLAAAEA